MLEKLTKINTYHMKLFAHFLEKLRSTPDGDGTLARPVDDRLRRRHEQPDTHLHHDLPMLLVGGGAGQIKGGRHLRFAR